MSKARMKVPNPSPARKAKKEPGLSRIALANKALEQHYKISDLCTICGIKIKVQIFKGSGVCCELHRKVRDNDFAPARAIKP